MDWKETLAALKGDPDIPQVPPTDDDATATTEKNQTDKLHITVERKGRKGKTATIIDGFTCDDGQLQETAKILKQKIGTGGSARGGEILLQGDWKERAAEILRKSGYKL